MNPQPHMKTDLLFSLGIAATTHVVAIFAFNDQLTPEPHGKIDDFVLICGDSAMLPAVPLEPDEIPDQIVDYSEAEAGSRASDMESGFASSTAPLMAGGPVLPADRAHTPIEIPSDSGPLNIGANVGPRSWASRGLPGIENLDNNPQVISQISPRYPHDMRRSGIDGQVMMNLVVGPDGRVRAAEAVKYSHRSFAETAITAVKKWRFEPGKRQGRRVAFRVTVPVLFSVTD